MFVFYAAQRKLRHSVIHSLSTLPYHLVCAKFENNSLLKKLFSLNGEFERII